MTKTKRQLRAEAVERLKNLNDHGVGVMFRAILGYSNWNHDWRDVEHDAIELLTDDEPPEGDAPSEFAEILMALAADCSCMGDGIVRHFEPKDVQGDVDALMRVVERDYVRRDDYDFTVEMLKHMTAERDELLGDNEHCELMYGRACDEVDNLQADFHELCRENDELRARIAEREAELTKRDKGIERLKRRRDELLAECERMRDELDALRGDSE